MSTFLDAVNRVLRLEGIIRGDDDEITSFSSSQHSAAISFAKIAIQEEIIWLVDESNIPYERTTGTVTSVASTRTYAMPTDFERFTEENQLWELDSSSEVEQIGVYRKEEHEVRKTDAKYETQAGTPTWFYFTGATTNTIGMYPVPDTATVYKFWYDKTVGVTTSTDTIPLVSTAQFDAFCSSAGRKFKFLRMSPKERDVLFPKGIEKDPVIEAKRSTVLRLLNLGKGTAKYGRRYG